MLRAPLLSIVLALLALSAAPAYAALLSAGVSKAPPIMTSAAAPDRQALVIVPDFAGAGGVPRGAVAQSDAVAYRELLRLLGFSVTTVAVDTRPRLDIESRNFAAAVKRDGEVAVFVLGTVIGAGGKLYVPAADLPPSARAPARIATEGLELGEILRRIQDRGPRELVALVDECGSGEATPSCPLGAGAVPDNVSVILAKRVPPRDDGVPVAGIASLRGELLPLMQEQDLTYLKLFEKLKARLDGTNATIAASPSLARSFAFLPGDFLAKLPTACNKVEDGASAEALKAASSLAPLIPACEHAAQTWAFSNYFRDKLTTAREQVAFQKSIAGCDDAAIDGYLDSYPNGAFRFAATDHKSECARQREPPPAPPPPSAPAPPPVAQGPSLQQRAYDAVTDYYQKHDYTPGGDFSGLAALYPSTFDRHGVPVARGAHLRDLARFYAPYADFRFDVIGSSLDFSDCRDASYCLVRGVAQRSSQKLNDPTVATGRLRFSLRFDLTYGTKVLSECAMVDGRPSRERPCE